MFCDTVPRNEAMKKTSLQRLPGEADHELGFLLWAMRTSPSLSILRRGASINSVHQDCT